MNRSRIVLLGMMTKIPVAGVVWQTLHYLVGLERLGYETYYVEAHARTPSMLMTRPDDDSAGLAAEFIAKMLEPFGFGQRWAYHALHDDGRCYGMSEAELAGLYRSAQLIVNLHGGTDPRPEHVATDRLVYLETDPVDVQVQLAQGRRETVDYLRPHCAYFTFAGNYGNQDCGLPFSDEFRFVPTRQPVVLDFWKGRGDTSGDRYTTVGNWRQLWREIQFRGETYGWSKEQEFQKYLDVPARTGRPFELALSAYTNDDRANLERHGWRVRDALSFSRDIDAYRDFIVSSRGEFTVAKDQNIRLRTGWFSDRSATYLAAGRPVLTQDTGFGNQLPVGEGLFAFSTLDDIATAVDAIESDYERHARAAAEIARTYFDSGRVLGSLLAQVGLPRLPPSLVIAVTSRHPTTLPPETEHAVLAAPLPAAPFRPQAEPDASVIVVTRDGLPFTRLCLETVLASAGPPSLELIVVDNGSAYRSQSYLNRLAERDSRVRVIENGRNRGFPAAVNQGLRRARGPLLMVLNNDVVLPPGSVARILKHLDDPTVGLVGPVSNAAATEAEIDVDYHTYDGFFRAAEERRRTHARESFELGMLTMFCVATRRDVVDRVGMLDEGFNTGLFEDDDYSFRVRRAGYRLVCAADVLVHHFGEAAFGALVPTGEYAALFDANRARFERKWRRQWRPHGRLPRPDYPELVRRIRATVSEAVPAGAKVLVVSRGDEELVRIEHCEAAHFPQLNGTYAGYYPSDSREAIAQLDALRREGAQFVVFPRTSKWWLNHYGALQDYLESGGTTVDSEDCVIYRLGAAN